MDSGSAQYMDANMEQGAHYIIQEPGSMVGMMQTGKSLLKPELAQHLGYKRGGFDNRSEARWLNQASTRGARVVPRKSVANNVQPMQTASGLLSLGTRFTPSSATALTSNAQGSSALNTSNSIINTSMAMDRGIDIRIANAIAGTSNRGRPRGRRPLRGQFPVVPIDMVRQLGIEQQVILQPAAPVAMKNKAILCRPLHMSRRTQANMLTSEISCQTDGDEGVFMECDESMGEESMVSTRGSRRESPRRGAAKKLQSPEKPSSAVALPKFFPIPVPVPVFVPVPVYVYPKPVPFPVPVPVPTPLPLAVMLEGPEEGEKFLRGVCEAGGVPGNPKSPKSPKSTSSSETQQVGQKRPLSRSSMAAGASPSAAKRSKIPAITIEPGAEDEFRLKFSYGINAWCHWVKQKLTSSQAAQYDDLRNELVDMTPAQLNDALSQFVTEVRKPNKEPYVADSIFYLCLGIQEYLNVKGLRFNIFSGPEFTGFAGALDKILANFQPRVSAEGLLICRIEEAHLWEANQLGSDTSQTLLFSVLYFNTKYLGLRSGESHRKLGFSHFKTHGNTVTCHLPQALANNGEVTSATVKLDQNKSDPSQCPTKLYQLYQSKCPTSLVSRGDVFYCQPNNKASSSGTWFSNSPVTKQELQIMLNRIKMVKEIQEAFMNSQQEEGF